MNDFLDELARLGQLQMKAEENIDKNFEEYWNSLTQEEQLASFYSVVKRIMQANSKGASYNQALYKHFNFPKSAHTMGILCGFMKLYNNLESDL